MLKARETISEHQNQAVYKIFVIIPYVYFLLILNRWIITPKGLASFGRLWQFYISYSDFGFLRRGLLGTILSKTRINAIITNEYIFAIVFVSIVGCVIAYLLYIFLCKSNFNRVSALAVALSPALLPHFGYAADNFDALAFVIASILILNITNIPVLVVGIAVGILMHEIFMFYVPILLAVLFLENRTSEKDAEGGETGNYRKNLVSAFAILVTCAVAYASLKIFGAKGVDQAEFEALMAGKTPIAMGKNAFWSGYFEIFSTLQENIEFSAEPLSRLLSLSAIKYILAPSLYLLLLLSVIYQWLRNRDILLLLMVVGASLAPLAISVVGADFLRWECMACNAALLAILALARRLQMQIPNPAAYAMIAFFLLAPFGSNPLERPLPVHQMIAEKFIPSLR
ncbi:hypothetical protein [Methylocystis bryophila]|uniref:Glycosyltransferase RgtA/B/C/D-like domain-containing protein n=1 Tax=Methylocystis bryophila TaxID=655015 RepID=A0A1W6MQU1_9HYPH|nr:hypothetical protein [Methylocystis bryophila]ARN79932.1 hypothetical protein B1812_01290 [Methylocystis bryophila]BDV39831.1 hypothetical protein DSM21852_30840 [Methylocystis bryophila]